MLTFSNRRILQSAVLPSIGFYDSASPERCDEQCTTNDERRSWQSDELRRVSLRRTELGQGLPSIQMHDRWSTSLDGWETDVADVVAHLTSAIATIAGHVAKPSDKVVDLMFLELDQAGHCMQRALLALDAFSSIAGLRAGRSSSSDAPKDEPPQRGAFDVGPSQLPRFEQPLGTC
jgi:hypothetical protein